jgi:hypothetical protein
MPTTSEAGEHRRVAELVGQRLNAIQTSGKQRHAIAQCR